MLARMSSQRSMVERTFLGKLNGLLNRACDAVPLIENTVNISVDHGRNLVKRSFLWCCSFLASKVCFAFPTELLLTPLKALNRKKNLKLQLWSSRIWPFQDLISVTMCN